MKVAVSMLRKWGMYEIIFIAVLFSYQGVCGEISSRIDELRVEPDFRYAKLRWRYLSQEEPSGFFIRLCEITAWMRTKNECFERHLFTGKQGSLRGHDTLTSVGKGYYEAVLYDLRMLTNYSLTVEPMMNQNLLLSDNRKPIGTTLSGSAETRFATKGFSAHATNCLSNSSDIVVKTGPFFGGKITVEGTTDEKCSVYGNRSSSKSIYVLRIDHKLCGSKETNGTRIDTVVLVHESSSVVTHNSRRFMVQCSFLPETFTIKAAFNVPPESNESKRNFNYKQLEEALQNIDSNDVFTYDHYKQNHVKDSRMSSEQGLSFQRNLPNYESQMLGLLVIVIVLVIAVILVIGFGLWWYINSYRRRCRNVDIETLSTTGSSFLAYHTGNNDDNEGLVRSNIALSLPPVPVNHDVCNHSRNENPFSGSQVALVSLKPSKDLY